MNQDGIRSESLCYDILDGKVKEIRPCYQDILFITTDSGKYEVKIQKYPEKNKN